MSSLSEEQLCIMGLYYGLLGVQLTKIVLNTCFIHCKLERAANNVLKGPFVSLHLAKSGNLTKAPAFTLIAKTGRKDSNSFGFPKAIWIFKRTFSKIPSLDHSSNLRENPKAC